LIGLRPAAVHEGTLRPAFEIAAEASALEALMKRSADTPMALAGACLVRLPSDPSRRPSFHPESSLPALPPPQPRRHPAS